MDFLPFLLQARLATYASATPATDLPDGCKEFTYSEGDLTYSDRYFGSNTFSGQEVLWQGGRAIWCQNYYGGMLSDAPPAETVYIFLQSALRLATPQHPFRGPAHYRTGDLYYTNEYTGVLEGFSGEEHIFFQGQPVYRLIYHGGRLA